MPHRRKHGATLKNRRTILKNHRTVLPELAVLSRPFKIKRLLTVKNPTMQESLLKLDIRSLISSFDQLEMNAQCPACGRRAKSLVFIMWESSSRLWCGECIPYWFRYYSGMMIRVSGYMNAISYVDKYLHGKRKYYSVIIRKLARLKGLKGTPGVMDALAFFGKDEECCKEKPKKTHPGMKRSRRKTRPETDTPKTGLCRNIKRLHHESNQSLQSSYAPAPGRHNKSYTPDYRCKSPPVIGRSSGTSLKKAAK